MANCKDCIHYEPCFEYGNILDPIHGGVKCDSFKPTADVAPKSEVAREIFEEIEEVLNNIGYFDELDFNALKKKYTEGDNQCAEERG